MNSFGKKLSYALEAAGLYLAFLVFYLLPAPVASNLGGLIGRNVGPRLATSRKALHNLRQSLPGKTDDEYAQIIRDMWDNLGRVIAEYPHLETIARKYTEMVGGEYFDELGPGAPCVLFSGHLSNWEMCSTIAYVHRKFAVELVYRAPNNPWVDHLLHKCRTLGRQLTAIPKSRTGVRNMVRALQEGNHLGILIDQKYNEGIAVPFFGRPAMTSPAFVQLAQKFDCPLFPARCERLGGCRFRLTIFPPMPVSGRAVEDVMAEAHSLLELWIKEHPGQWLWLHRRWG